MSIYGLQDAAQNMALAITAFLNGKTEFEKYDEYTGKSVVFRIRNKT